MKTNGTYRLDVEYHFKGFEVKRELSSLDNYHKQPIKYFLEDSLLKGKSPEGGATYSVGNIPTILIGDMNEDGTISHDLKNSVDEEFFDSVDQRLNIRPYDVLIAKDGATTGKVAMVAKDFPYSRCIFNEHIYVLRAKKKLYASYLFFFLMSGLGQMQLFRQKSGGAQGGIVDDFIDGVMLPLLPDDAMRTYVEEAQKSQKRYQKAKRLSLDSFDSFMGVLNLTNL